MNAKVAEAITHGPHLLLRFLVAGLLGMAFYALLTTFAIAAEYSYLRFTPASHWFEYESVEPDLPVKAGEGLFFKSTAAVHRRADLRWSDTLFCDTGSGRFFYRNITTSRDQVSPRSKGTVRWAFIPFTLPTGTVCEGEHVITASLKYGIAKRQVVKSGPFTVQ